MKRSFKKLLAYAAALVICVQGGAVFASAEGTASEVTQLTIAEYPDVMAYHIGDELITDGIRVEASYEDGTTADVTADCTFDYDFSQKGNAQVEVAYEGLTTSFESIVIGDSAKFYMVDPAEGSEDVGFYFKEGAALSECYLWEDDYHIFIEDVDDEGTPCFLEVKLKEKQITGYDSTPGEKTLTAKVPVGTQTIDVSFPALVIPEEDFDQYMKWRSLSFVYNVCAHDREALTTEQYNYTGKVTGENVDFLVDYICNMGEDLPFDYEETVPADDLKAWMEKYFVIRSFDLTGSPNYNAENDTYYFLPYSGYGGWGLWYFRAQWKTNEAGDTVVQYRVKDTDPLYKHNTDLVISSDGRIVSVTMMPEKLELVSAPSKTAYKQGENLDLTGGQIKAIYDEERSETLPITADMISGYDSAKAGKQTVTVTYGGQSVTFDVTVTASENPSPIVIDDKETGIRLEASEGVVPSDTVLKTEKVTDGENFTIVDKALTDTADKWVAYDISLLSDNAEIQPNGKVKIAIPRPTELNADKLALFHVAEDGKLTPISFTLDEATDSVVFETDHFSLYVVAEKTGTDSGSSNPPTGYNGQGILPLAVLLMAGAAVLLLRKRQAVK